MSSAKLFIMPDEFLSLQLNLQSSACETTILTPISIQPTPTQSKLAGYPYLPENEQPVLDQNGQPMLLLAQLNFADIIAPKDFPSEGLLQFFIAQNCYERYSPAQAHSLFSVRYYPTITNHTEIVPPDFLRQANFANFPIQAERALFSYTQVEPVSATDFRLAHYIDPFILAQPFTPDGQTLHDIYFEYFLSADHKIGGYPYFIEEDIRLRDSSFAQYDTLLFQLISNDAQSIMWGDSGVISFFINGEKLKQHDFSDILFYAEDY